MSVMTDLWREVVNKGYKDPQGTKLASDASMQEILRLSGESYFHGLVNGIKRYSVMRDDRRVVGKFDKDFTAILKGLEEEFGMEYKTNWQLKEEIKSRKGK